MVAESHSRVPEGYVWSWLHGPISCAGWGQSSSLAVCSSYLRLSLFTASSALAAWCAPQPPPWSQLHNHQQLSSCICLPACLWRKRDSAGLHSAQIPPSADSVNIQTKQLLHWHAVIKRQKCSSINTSPNHTTHFGFHVSLRYTMRHSKFYRWFTHQQRQAGTKRAQSTNWS